MNTNSLSNTIALLATGNELTNGDILDTNGQYFAQAFQEHGIKTGLHLTVSDEQKEIELAIRFLLEQHAALIIVGGLGPTSDDRTRFALSEAIQLPLQFNEASWQAIVDRMTKRRLPIPDTNRQQAYFPEGAAIIPNPRGTAAACYIQHNNKWIYMLPGPPSECLPLFDKVVLPHLLTLNLSQPQFRKSWLLIGVSESHIAEQLEPLMINSHCTLGYRVSYPYLEIKLQTDNSEHLKNLATKFDMILAPHLVSINKEKASTQLRHHLKNTQTKIYIVDQATHGMLESVLITPETYQHVKFMHEKPVLKAEEIAVTITGLSSYWETNEDSPFTELNITVSGKNHHYHNEEKITVHGINTRLYATEICCFELMKYFNEKLNLSRQ